MPDPIPAAAVLSDLHITLWREQMAQRERAEKAEASVAELASLLSAAEAVSERLAPRLAEALAHTEDTRAQGAADGGG